MKILVLDPRNGDHCADLFIVDAAKWVVERMPLGYAPELHYDAQACELVVVETSLQVANGECTRYWLKRYSATTLGLIGEQETPVRPMYAGYPNRSTRIKSSPSGRYLYLLEAMPHPTEVGTFRLLAHRYDRMLERLEPGRLAVDSCMVDFDHLGDNEEDLYFHLACEFPSTVVFGCFSSPELAWVRMDDLPGRVHSPRETCGSWVAKPSRTLYCIAGNGTIYQVRRQPPASALFLKLPLTNSRSIPLKQLYGSGNWLFAGVSTDDGERSLGLASEIWQVSLAGAKVVRVIDLPFPVINFVTTADGEYLVGVNPYNRMLCLVETASGLVLEIIEDVGISPAEVMLIY
jgi:hypothetical protein